MTLPKQGPFTKKVTDLPNSPSPNFTAEEIKSYMQTPADELAVTLNSLSDELVVGTAAGNIGAKDGSTDSTVQAVLNKLESDKSTNLRVESAEARITSAEEKLTSVEVTATEALDNTEYLQAQYDQMAKTGDSSLEAAQARVKADGTSYGTLRDRLNASDAQLADNANKIGSSSTLPLWLQNNLYEVSKMHDDYLRQNGINIRQPPYNAKGDGVSDDTIAIQNALNDANYDTVYFPKGTYKISTKLSVTVANKTLIAQNPYLTSIVRDGSDSNILEINAVRVQVKGMGFKHTGAVATSGNAIEVKGSYSTIDNIYIEDVYTGVHYNGNALTHSAHYLSNFNIKTFQNVGVLCTKVNDVFLNNFIINANNTTALSGIRLQDKVEAFSATNGDILNGNYSMTTEASVNGIGTRPAYCKFTNVFFDSSQTGVNLDKCVMFRFSNCWFSNRPGNGCTVRTVDDVTFENCEFTNSGASGCNVKNVAKRVKFRGCSFVSNNYSNVGGHGLSIDPNTTDFVVQGCTATNGLGFGGLQGYGIIINTGTSDRYNVSDNLVSGNATGGVTDGGSGANKRVANNY